MIKKNVKYFFVLIIIILIVFIAYILCIKIQKKYFEKILKDNDMFNYELVENINGKENIVYVRDKVLFSISENVGTWVSEIEEKRVVFDKEHKTVIIDENDKELKVNSLNYTYINDYFNSKSQKFKYLGKKDGYYELQFIEKNNNKNTHLFINENTKIVEKVVQKFQDYETIILIYVKKNEVSKDEIKYPDLEGYRVYDSSRSNPK